MVAETIGQVIAPNAKEAHSLRSAVGEALTKCPVGRTRTSDKFPGLTLQIRGQVLTFRKGDYVEQYLIKNGNAYLVIASLFSKLTSSEKAHIYNTVKAYAIKQAA